MKTPFRQIWKQRQKQTQRQCPWIILIPRALILKNKANLTNYWLAWFVFAFIFMTVHKTGNQQLKCATRLGFVLYRGIMDISRVAGQKWSINSGSDSLFGHEKKTVNKYITKPNQVHWLGFLLAFGFLYFVFFFCFFKIGLDWSNSLNRHSNSGTWITIALNFKDIMLLSNHDCLNNWVTSILPVWKRLLCRRSLFWLRVLL